MGPVMPDSVVLVAAVAALAALLFVAKDGGR